MRVLITGCTATQVKPRKESGNDRYYVSIPALLAEALTELGHEVDWRPISPVESLCRYDKVVVFLTSINKLGATYHLGALSALAKRRDAIISFDDWQYQQVAGSFVTSSKRLQYYLWGSSIAVQRKGMEEAYYHRPTRNRIERLVTKLAKTPGVYNHRLLLWTFPWGDPDRLGVRSRTGTVGVDLSPMVPIRQAALRDRRKRWLLATLGDHATWLKRLDLSWPVDWYGHKKGTHPRVSEHVITNQLLPTYQGILSPRYPHAGGGWWRVRFLYAAMNAVPILGDLEETAPIGPGYGLKPHEFEDLSPTERRELGVAQRRTFFKRIYTHAEALRAIDGVIRA